MKQIIYVLTAVMAVFLLTACDYLLPLPLGRDNPADDGVQVGGFLATVSGTDAISTFWDWHTPSSSVPDSQIIDKIRIVYNKNDLPSSMSPLNKDYYIDITSSDTWSYEWKNLKQGTEYFFALYGHEKSGTWLAPKYTKVWISYNGVEERTNMNFTRLYVNTSNSTNTVFQPTAGDFIHQSPDVTIFFIVFDFNSPSEGEYGAVLDAQLTDFTMTNTGTVDIIPMRKQVHDGMMWDDISDTFYYDREKAKKNVYIASNTDLIQIKDQLNVSRWYGTNTVAIIPNTGSPIQMEVDSTSFNNSSINVWWSK